MFVRKVQISGVDTSKLPVLTKKEIFNLFYQLQREGKEEAREELVCGNLRLVLSVLQRFSNRGEYVDDIFQIGCIGLVKAIDNFDLDQGVYFSTYAVPMIIGEIKRYLRDNDSTDPLAIIDVVADEKEHGGKWLEKLSLQEALEKLKNLFWKRVFLKVRPRHRFLVLKKRHFLSCADI